MSFIEKLKLKSKFKLPERKKQSSNKEKNNSKLGAVLYLDLNYSRLFIFDIADNNKVIKVYENIKYESWEKELEIIFKSDYKNLDLLNVVLSSKLSYQSHEICFDDNINNEEDFKESLKMPSDEEGSIKNKIFGENSLIPDFDSKTIFDNESVISVQINKLNKHPKDLLLQDNTYLVNVCNQNYSLKVAALAKKSNIKDYHIHTENLSLLNYGLLKTNIIVESLNGIVAYLLLIEDRYSLFFVKDGYILFNYTSVELGLLFNIVNPNADINSLLEMINIQLTEFSVDFINNSLKADVKSEEDENRQLGGISALFFKNYSNFNHYDLYQQTVEEFMIEMDSEKSDSKFYNIPVDDLDKDEFSLDNEHYKITFDIYHICLGSLAALQNKNINIDLFDIPRVVSDSDVNKKALLLFATSMLVGLPYVGYKDYTNYIAWNQNREEVKILKQRESHFKNTNTTRNVSGITQEQVNEVQSKIEIVRKEIDERNLFKDITANKNNSLQLAENKILNFYTDIYRKAPANGLSLESVILGSDKDFADILNIKGLAKDRVSINNFLLFLEKNNSLTNMPISTLNISNEIKTNLMKFELSNSGRKVEYAPEPVNQPNNNPAPAQSGTATTSSTNITTAPPVKQQ